MFQCSAHGQLRPALRRSDDVMSVRGGARADNLHPQRAEPLRHHRGRVADDPDARAARDMSAFEGGERPRDIGIRGQHVRVVERGDHHRVRRRIGHADDHCLGIAGLDRLHGHLDRDPERGAGRDGRERGADDLSQHGDLCRRDVRNVPHVIRRDAGPRLVGATPFAIERSDLVEFLADQTELGVAGRGGDRLGLDRGRLLQILAQRVAPLRPIGFPEVLGVDPCFRSDGKPGRIGRCFRIGAFLPMGPQRSASFGRRPELVPSPKRPVIGQRLIVLHGDLTKAGADIDMTGRTQRLEVRLHSGILGKGLNEGADRVLHHRSHLFLQLRKLGRRKTLVEPVVIGFKVELGVADQKIRLAVTEEWGEPGVSVLEIPLECADVGRLRGDDAPTENADSLPIAHRGAL